MNRGSAQQVASFSLFAAAMLVLAYGPTRSEGIQLITIYGVAFGAYLWVLRKVRFTWRMLTIAAIGLRLALLFAPITWTDDHFRYLWDGLCSIHGISPFEFRPSVLLEIRPDVFTQELFDRLNSPDHYTVYPPISQLIFALAAWSGQGDLFHSALALRLIMVVADISTIAAMGSLLRSMGDRTARVAIYALNPLVLMEITVNVHTEVLILPFLLLAVRSFHNKRYDLSATLIALAAAVKLWPLIFLAWFPTQLSWRLSARSVVFALMVFLLMWTPFVSNELVRHFTSSLGLFVSYLEFNGGIFEALRWLVGDGIVKATGLLPALTVLCLLLFTMLQYRRRSLTMQEGMLWLLTIYLFGSQAVHPWYILPLIAISVLSGHQWPILWSLLIIPTYLTYRSEPYVQPYWWIALEYACLIGFMVHETIKRKKEEWITTRSTSMIKSDQPSPNL